MKTLVDYIKLTLVYLLPIVILLLCTISCSHRYYGYSRHIPYRTDTISSTANDTTEIIYETLVRTLGEEIVPNFELVRDRKNIFVLSTHFPLRVTYRDTVKYEHLPPIVYVTAQVGSSRFALVTPKEMLSIARKEHRRMYALELGNIIIRGDEAFTGIRMYGFAGNTDKDPNSSPTSSGIQITFHRYGGRWVFIPGKTIFWIT